MTPKKIRARVSACSDISSPSIQFGSSATWHGLAYAPGDIIFQGSCEFTGTCMAGGTIRMFGSPGGITYDDSTPEEPDDTPDPTTILRVTAWQK